MWSGDITWLERDGYNLLKVPITGRVEDNIVTFEYAWKGTKYLARFDMQIGRGTSRRVDSPEIYAIFNGNSKVKDDQVQMWGLDWLEGANQCGRWGIDLGDYY